MSEYLLPDVGEGLTEAEIVTWKVKVGDEIAINDVVVEIETAKSLVELPSPYAGTVEALLVPEGETVPVGMPIIRIGDGVETPPPGGAPEIDLSNPSAGGENQTLVGYGPREAAVQRRRRRGPATPAAEAAANTQMQVQGAFTPGGAQSGEVVAVEEPLVARRAVPAGPSGGSRALAKPPVRKLAKDLGVDLGVLTGSGPSGSITRADVEGAVGMPASYDGHPGDVAETAVPGALREWREPVKGVRKAMSQAMVASAFTAPHVTEWVTVDVTRTSELVERLRARREFADVRVTPLLVLAKACLLAIRRTPVVNSWWDDAAQEVVHKSYVNLGIAAATPRGLVVPNVKEAQALSLRELAAALEELTSVAREGRTQPADMAGGTFTITNVGVFGVDGGTPIINPGESAILCFGATRRQPWVVGSGADERIEIRDVCTLALSFDHRHIDGEAGSRFLADVAAIMEDPATALLF